MITASFISRNGHLCEFCISGHAGYAEQGSDIVCAAVSSMAFLTVNTATDSFGIDAEVYSDEKKEPVIGFRLKSDSETGSALIRGLMRELEVLQEDCPKYVRVVKK